jgi:hypothetical protein
MRKIIEYTMASVDGVFTAPEILQFGQYDNDAYNSDGLGQLCACDAVLLGRVANRLDRVGREGSTRCVRTLSVRPRSRSGSAEYGGYQSCDRGGETILCAMSIRRWPLIR